MSSDFQDFDQSQPLLSDGVSASQTSSSLLSSPQVDPVEPVIDSANLVEPLPPLKQEVSEPVLKITYTSHASPLMPLRTRDLQALHELFQQDEIEVIEADIAANLLKRSPTPDWEDFTSLLLHDSF